MRPFHPLPRQWLMTDERLEDGLFSVVGRMPRGSGIVFRHYTLPPTERRALFACLLRIARRRGLVLVRAGNQPFVGEAGVHGRPRALKPGIRTYSVHNPRELMRARLAGASLVFISPVRPTRSHPGVPALGLVRAALLARRVRGAKPVALGGVTAHDGRQLARLGFHGWAGIDAWRAGQKRKAVPI